MNDFSGENNTATQVRISLDMQIAIQIVKKCHIFLVRDAESGKLIPYYYKENRYAADPAYNIIRGVVKEEIVSLFNILGNASDKTGIPEQFSVYSVSEKDFNDYNKVGYINRLTKNVEANIGDFHHLIKDEAAFDADPYEINTQSGIFNIRTGELLPHTPEKLVRNIANAKYSNNNKLLNYGKQIAIVKTPSLFYKIIGDALLDKTKSDIENREIVQSFMEILASFLIGNNEHKLVYILLGAPNTGKSTLLEVLLGIFFEYGATFNNSAIMVSSRTANDIRPDLIALKGKRLIVGSEAHKTEKFDNALLKQISGNDKLSVRKPHKGDMVTFIITGKLMLATNYCPMFTDLDDKAFLNRIVLIDLNNIPPAFDTGLKEKLLAPESRDAIFTYLAHIACKIVSNKNIFIHERFAANKQRILVNQNSSVSLFWKAHIRPYDEYIYDASLWPKNPVQLLYSVMYLDFCHRIDVKPLSLEAFAKEFKSLADVFPLVQWKKGESNNFYVGFQVVDGNAAQYHCLLGRGIMDKSAIDNRNGLYS